MQYLLSSAILAVLAVIFYSAAIGGSTFSGGHLWSFICAVGSIAGLIFFARARAHKPN